MRKACYKCGHEASGEIRVTQVDTRKTVSYILLFCKRHRPGHDRMHMSADTKLVVYTEGD